MLQDFGTLTVSRMKISGYGVTMSRGENASYGRRCKQAKVFAKSVLRQAKRAYSNFVITEAM